MSQRAATGKEQETRENHVAAMPLDLPWKYIRKLPPNAELYGRERKQRPSTHYAFQPIAEPTGYYVVQAQGGRLEFLADDEKVYKHTSTSAHSTRPMRPLPPLFRD